MTATWLREGRLMKGLTQKELAEQSNISVRSIQRIENGDLIPRSYTLKTLAGILGLSFDDFLASARTHQIEISDKDVDIVPLGRGNAMRWILSVGVSLIVVLLAFAYVVQSPTFPETTFEVLLLMAATLGVLMFAWMLIWRKRK